MGYLYFTRHGQTIWNAEDKICGATDIALTELGRKQAAELGKTIRAMMEKGEIRIDRILASPLSRASDTAEIISGQTGIPWAKEERLTEQNFGRFESTSPRNGAEFRAAKQNFIHSFGGGETMLHLSHRIYSVIDEIEQDTKETGRTTLIVAHNGISRVVRSYFEDMTNEEFSSFGIKNCQLLRFEFPEKRDIYGRAEKINSVQTKPDQG
ncbi:histidine phosphatase family protein [[Clostridium] aminophilum]|uniref:histidine phosphatase family protein n=1 Tax=[Clostridium] aminophilum TaxID=1526 RepID=UPI0026F22C7E|nr:histidine phosphatase family protein [[Clostridium] aminophilum]MDD6197076.1 histidine phosphatase family protein [[Clostridium] aminophilum]